MVFIKYLMIGVLIIGIIATWSWQYLTYKKLKNSGQTSSFQNIKKLPDSDKVKKRIFLLRRIGYIGIGSYLIWFLFKLISNIN